MRPFLAAIAIAASLGVASGVSAQAVDHSAHHPADAAKSAKSPTVPAKPAQTAQMQCKGMMDAKRGAAKGGPSANQEKKHCAEMMAQMHGDHAKPAK